MVQPPKQYQTFQFHTLSSLKFVSLTFLLFSGIFLSIYFGADLKDKAGQIWFDNAMHEVEDVTLTCLFWFLMQQAEIRGLSALFQGSQQVTKNEFLDAIDSIEGIDSIPLNSIAFAERIGVHDSEVQGLHQYRVTLGFGNDEVTQNGTDLSNYPEISLAIESAFVTPGQIVMSPAFSDNEGNRFFNSRKRAY